VVGVLTWIVLRAAGIAAYLMLFATVAWGLVGTSAAMGKRLSRATAVSIHQFISTAAVVLLGVHLGGLLVDSFMPFTPVDVLVPLHTSFRPVSVAFGIVAMYAAVVVLVSSWLRKRMSTKAWRRLHLLAVPAFAMSMVHGVLTGTDTVRPWMWWTYVATGAIVLFLLVLRGLTVGLRPQRHAPPPGARTRAPQELATSNRAAQTTPARSDEERTTTDPVPVPASSGMAPLSSGPSSTSNGRPHPA